MPRTRQAPTLCGPWTAPPIPALWMIGIRCATRLSGVSRSPGSTIASAPGAAGHERADGYVPGGAPRPFELSGVVLAALATLALGACSGRRRR